MKTIMYFFMALALITFSCNKDEEQIKPLVPISGNMVNTPDPSGGFDQIQMPDGSIVTLPKKFKVAGTCGYLGAIDESKSFLEVTHSFKGLFIGEAKITLTGEKGDQLILQGTVYTAADFSNKGYFHFIGGTGIFKNAEGWMNSIGQFDQNGINTLSAAGEITEPSNNN